MAARSHLFPFRTEKLSSLSPMVLNFGRVGSRRFQESISLRLTPFFVSGRSASARKSRRRGFGNSFLRQFSALRKTIGDGRQGTMCHLRRQERLEDATSGASVTRDEVSGYENHNAQALPGRQYKTNPSYIINPPPSHLYTSILNLSHPNSSPLRRRQSVTVVR